MDACAVALDASTLLHCSLSASLDACLTDGHVLFCFDSLALLPLPLCLPLSLLLPSLPHLLSYALFLFILFKKLADKLLEWVGEKLERKGAWETKIRTAFVSVVCVCVRLCEFDCA